MKVTREPARGVGKAVAYPPEKTLGPGFAPFSGQHGYLFDGSVPGRGTQLWRGFPPAPQGGRRREALGAGPPRPGASLPVDGPLKRRPLEGKTVYAPVLSVATSRGRSSHPGEGALDHFVAAQFVLEEVAADSA